MPGCAWSGQITAKESDRFLYDKNYSGISTAYTPIFAFMNTTNFLISSNLSVHGNVPYMMYGHARVKRIELNQYLPNVITQMSKHQNSTLVTRSQSHLLKS